MLSKYLKLPSSRLMALLGLVAAVGAPATPQAFLSGTRGLPPVSPDEKRRERLRRAKQYQPNGERECARRRRPIAAGVLEFRS